MLSKRNLTLLAFCFAGFLAGVLWLCAVYNFLLGWAWILGALFAFAMLGTFKARSSHLGLQVSFRHSVIATILLSLSWPLSVFAFGTILMTAKDNSWMPFFSMTIGMCVAAFCVSLALRVLTNTWDGVIFKYLLLSGVIAIELLTAVLPPMATYFSDQFPSALLLGILVLPGSSVYGGLFGLGIVRKQDGDLGFVMAAKVR